MFHTWLLLCLFLWHVVGVFGVDPDKVKSVSVMEGDSVTLHTDLTQIQHGDEIEWSFGPEDIARIKREIFYTYDDDVLDGIFGGRLHLNHQTGDLTITNITTEHAGLYQLNIITGYKDTIKTFSVTVYGVFDVESVSVMEGDSVTLHTDLTQIQHVDVIDWWFESEEILIATIRREIGVFNTSDDVLDGRFRGRLHLNHQTGDLTITNITTEHAGLYHLFIFTGNEPTIKTFSVTVSEDYVRGCGCGFTETVNRLVISGLVGVAAVAVLV